MGVSDSKLISTEDFEAYKNLTDLNQSEIKKCRDMYLEMLEDEERKAVIERKSLKESSLDHDKLLKKMPELKVNPFGKRLCQVFSLSEEKMEFEEFLGMMSVMGERASPEMKAEWAFRVYDFDGDDRITKEDIVLTIKHLTESDDTSDTESKKKPKQKSDRDVEKSEITPEQIEKIAELVLKEANFKEDVEGDDEVHPDSFIDIDEFKRIVTKSPNFVNSFRIRL